MTSIRHGTPRENRACSVAFTPYALSPASRVSADAVSVSWSPETV